MAAAAVTRAEPTAARTFRAGFTFQRAPAPTMPPGPTNAVGSTWASGSIQALGCTPAGGRAAGTRIRAARAKSSPGWGERITGSLPVSTPGGAITAVARVFASRVDPAEREEIRAKYPPQRHPVIRTHPETDRKVIYVNSTFTKKLVGMKRAESAALLSFLYTHIVSVEFQCRFRWRTNSLVIWDNRCTQHRVVTDDIRAHRRVERVTIIGDEPY